MPLLRALTLRPFSQTHFPFSLPILSGLGELTFESPVTLFVGENGTGKSTLLEAIACAVESVTVGSEPVKSDPLLAAQRELAGYLKLTWTRRVRRGFFLRAEDFFGYAKRLTQMRAEMEEDLRRVDREYQGRSAYARSLAKVGTAGQLHDMQRRYGDGLEGRSHGEGFLALFQQRFVPGGLYLLDEPEAALSPLRQLTLISLLKEMTAQDGQFIIATHSPMLMAFPEAQILLFDGGRISKAQYDQLEHVRLVRQFLEDPRAFIEHL